MTATKKTNTVVDSKQSNIFRLNILLLLLAVFFFGFYIVRVNKTADLRYKVSLLKSSLVKENSLTQSLLDQQQGNMQNLITFAHARGMVEVTNYLSFFEESGVALNN